MKNSKALKGARFTERRADGIFASALAAAAALAAMTGTIPSPAQAAGAVQQNGALVLAVGESRLINLPAAMSDVVIADPAVLDVHVRSQRQIFLIAKGAGETTFFITDKAGKQLYSNSVRVGNNLTSIDQMLRLAMPESTIQVNTLNGMTLLTGTVAAPEDAAEAERLVAAFVGEKNAVVSRLRTATPLQVNLQVRIAEVNKTLSKNIGFNLATADGTGGFKFGLGQGRSFYPQWTVGGPILVGTESSVGTTTATGITPGTSLFGSGKLLGLDILGALDLAETQGLASTLANPNLTALSGETASFLAGGEIPIPLSSGLGNVSVEFKQYGVSLSFTPTVLADGRISMRVRPEVSQLDNGSAVRLSGFTIPGISTRRAETTVELGSGQSFMIGGLLSNTSGNTIEKAPFLGDLPILGNLFKSTGYRRQETELVIVVTPYLVKPVDASQITLPSDGYRNATDMQRIFGNKIQDGTSSDARTKPRAETSRVVTPDQVVPGEGPARRSGSSTSTPAPGFSF